MGTKREEIFNKSSFSLNRKIKHRCVVWSQFDSVHSGLKFESSKRLTHCDKRTQCLLASPFIVYLFIYIF